MSNRSNASSEAAQLCESLQRWLCHDAYPLWWERGADRMYGGFHESLQLDGSATNAPRRARLHPRQICAYSIANQLGWSGPRVDAVRHGLDFFLAHYRRPDPLIRTLVAADGSPLDDRAVLYDQAFALLGFACAYQVLADESLRQHARDLLDELRAGLSNGIGFEESPSQPAPRLSNSHMHLFEAALAWMELDADVRWQRLASEIAELALTGLIDRDSGFIREYFDARWQPLPGIEGQIVEPGHQFEWGWLLLRWYERTRDEGVKDAALRLIDLAELHGVDHGRGVAITSILCDRSVLDPVARLWPQTERLKAACLAATTTRKAEYWTMVVASARGLSKYLDTPLPGLWWDKMDIAGSFIAEPVPASSLYHIVGAVAELKRAIDA
jgi:mannose-6-phosphate isomerase